MHVYFIKSGNRRNAPIKIGKANNVKKRLETMQTGNPDELVLLSSVFVGSEKLAQLLESKLHYAYRRERIRGEWFAGSIKLDIADRIVDETINTEHGIEKQGIDEELDAIHLAENADLVIERIEEERREKVKEIIDSRPYFLIQGVNA